MRTATPKKSSTPSVKPIIKKTTPKKFNSGPITTKVVKALPAIKVTPAITQAQPQLPHHSKQSLLIALLSNPNGSDMNELMQATGWQAHSIRGVISGVIKKRLGLPVISEKIEGSQRYRIQVI